MFRLASVVLLVLSLAPTARAEDPSNLVLDVGSTTCVARPRPPSAESEALVTLRVEAGVVVSKVRTADGVALPAEDGPFSGEVVLTVSRDTVQSDAVDVVVETNQGDGILSCQTESGEAVRLFTDGIKGGGNLPPGSDLGAARWWGTYGAAKLEALAAQGKGFGLPNKPWFGRPTEYRVHLPSGAPAFGFAGSMSEGSPVQVVQIVSTAQLDGPVLSVDFVACEDLESFRIDLKTDGRQGLSEGDTSDDYELVPIGPAVKCGAGDLKYSLKLGEADPVETKLRVRPTYHLAAVAAIGWDGATRDGFAKESTDEENQFTIRRNDDKEGAIGYVGAQWMIGGVDYGNMRWWNYFANLVVAANPASPLDDFLVGLAITPTGSISVLTGLTVHEGSRLKKGYEVGGMFEGDGDLPVEDSWKDANFGGFIGLSIDSRIYDAVIEQFSD